MPASLLDPDYQFGTSPLPGASGPPTDLLGLGQLQVTPQDQNTDQGAALGQTYQMITDAIARQREQSRQMGLLGDNGLPTGAGVVDAARQYAQGVMMGTTAPGDVPPPGIVAYHGSPADFDRFDDRFIGTGEGAQAYGRGHYFGGAEETGRSYRDALTPETIPNPEFNAAQQDYNAKYGAVGNAAGATDAEFNAAIAARDAAHEKMKSLSPTIPNPAFPGHMYEVNIGADPEHFLDWDKPLSEQHPVVQQAVKDAGLVDPKPTIEWQGDPSLWELHQNGRPTGTMLEDAGDGRTYNEIVNGKLTGSIPKGAVDAWKDMHAQSLRDAYRDPDPTGRDLIKNNPGIEPQLHTIGLPGIRYLDQGSRGAGQGTHNYVVFDAGTIDILRKYGIAGLIAGGGAAATQRQSNAQ